MTYSYLPLPIAALLRNLEQERATQAVRPDDKTATWHVFRYSDVARVLTDARYFGAARSSRSALSASFHPQLPQTDPQRHMVVRKLMREAVTPGTVAKLQSSVESTVGRLLDPLLPAGKLEVMSYLTQPLATAVLAGFLGDPAF